MRIKLESLLSIFALILSLVSLLVAIWLENNAQERELLFESYDRLTKLAIVTQKEIASKSKSFDDAKNAKTPKESTDVLDKWSSESFDNATKAMWSIELHQFALSEEAIASLNRNFKYIGEKYMLWEEAAKKQEATDKHVLDYARALDTFWGNIKNAVETSMTEIARRIRL